MGLKTLSLGILVSLSQSVSSQSVTSLVDKLNQYQANWPEPHLMLWFNQDKYAPGDTVFFRAFYQLTPKPDQARQELVEVALVNGAGAAILTSRFLVDEQQGQGQLVLPDTLHAGLYQVTAFTNWMRNFNKRTEQVLPVVREHEVLPVPSDRVKFRTESGHLVAGIPNTVYVNTEKRHTEFEIRNEHQQLIHKLTTNAWGSAVFTITPTSGDFFQWTGDTTRHPLPERVNQGVVIHSNQTATMLEIQVIRAGDTRPLVFILSGNGRVYFSTEETGEKIAVSIPKKQLGSGIIKLSVLTPDGQLMASRDFYLGNRMQAPSIQLLKETFKPREWVEVTVSPSDAASWAFRVTHRNLEVVTAGDHQAWIRAGFASPFPMDSITHQQLDHWLVAETAALPWNTIRQSTAWRYPPLKVVERSGLVVNRNTQLPVAAATQVVVYLQKKKFLYQTFTGADARISLAIPDLYGEDEFFYKAAFRNNPVAVNVIWYRAELSFSKAPAFRITESNDVYGVYRSTVRLIEDSYSAFSPLRSVTTDTTRINFQMFLGEPDVNILLDRYISFPTMYDLIREVVPALTSRITKKGSWVRVALATWQSTHDPVYVIDDYATDDTDYFLSLNPTDVESVGIYNTPRKLILLGLMGRQGIVVVTTKTKRAQQIVPGRVIQGMAKPIHFPAMATGSAPEYRSTVYWNAAVGNRFGFTTSDDLGEVRIEGVSLVDGVPVYGLASLKVNLDK